MDVTPRGPLSAALIKALRAPLHPQPDLPLLAASRIGDIGAQDTVVDEDVQLALYLMYELHHGLDEADPRWEWAPDLLAARAVLETAFEADLRRRFAVAVPDRPVVEALTALTAETARPGAASLSVHVAREATREQLAELVVQDSLHRLKGADPHSWAVPRLRGRAKGTLVRIQAAGYGHGRPDRMHATLFATTMTALALDATPDAYLDVVAAPSLARVNALSMFGLHRRLVAALCGHLAAVETTTGQTAARWAQGLRRLEVDESAAAFFDEHVPRDAVPGPGDVLDLCAGLVEQDPRAHADVLWGASVWLGLDGLVTRRTQRAWAAGRSTLRGALRDNA